MNQKQYLLGGVFALVLLSGVIAFASSVLQGSVRLVALGGDGMNCSPKGTVASFVCAKNGRNSPPDVEVTYFNSCTAEGHGAEIIHEGVCEGHVPCTNVADPVCGNDGNTWVSACDAQYTGGGVQYEGACEGQSDGGFNGPGGCTTTEACIEYCSYHSRECIDYCETYPDACTEIGMPPIRLGPGGCGSADECMQYCAGSDNAQECQEFCEANPGACEDVQSPTDRDYGDDDNDDYHRAPQGQDPFQDFDPDDFGDRYFGPDDGDHGMRGDAKEIAREALNLILDNMENLSLEYQDQLDPITLELTRIRSDQFAEAADLLARAEEIFQAAGVDVVGGGGGPPVTDMMDSIRAGIDLLGRYADPSGVEEAIDEIMEACSSGDLERCEDAASDMEDLMMDLTRDAHRNAEAEDGTEAAIALCIDFMTVMEPVIDDPMVYANGVEFACEMFGEMGWDPRAMDAGGGQGGDFGGYDGGDYSGDYGGYDGGDYSGDYGGYDGGDYSGDYGGYDGGDYGGDYGNDAGDASPPDTQSCVSPPGLPVSWWNADNVSGTTVPDGSKVHRNNGTIVGGVTSGAVDVGYVFEFDGSSGYINMGNPESLNFGTGPFSLEAWFYSDGGGSNINNIMRKSNYPVSGPGAGYWLRIGGGNLEFHVGETTGIEGQPRGSVTTPVRSNTWYHVVGTRDSSGTMKLYVDGELKGTAQAPNANTTSNAPFTLGAWDDRFGVSELLSGLLDQVSVYTNALDASDVQDLFDAGSTRKCAS